MNVMIRRIGHTSDVYIKMTVAPNVMHLGSLTLAPPILQLSDDYNLPQDKQLYHVKVDSHIVDKLSTCHQEGIVVRIQLDIPINGQMTQVTAQLNAVGTNGGWDGKLYNKLQGLIGSIQIEPLDSRLQIDMVVGFNQLEIRSVNRTTYTLYVHAIH